MRYLFSLLAVFVLMAFCPSRGWSSTGCSAAQECTHSAERSFTLAESSVNSARKQLNKSKHAVAQDQRRINRRKARIHRRKWRRDRLLNQLISRKRVDIIRVAEARKTLGAVRISLAEKKTILSAAQSAERTACETSQPSGFMKPRGFFGMTHGFRVKRLADGTLPADWNERVDNSIQLMRELGVEVIRVSINWYATAGIESAAPKTDELTRNLISRLNNAGFKVQATLGNIPFWMWKAPWNDTVNPDPPTKDCSNPAQSINTYLREDITFDRFLEHYDKFLRAVVRELGDQVESWEIWNEPDNCEFWPGTHDEYRQLLIRSFQVFNQEKPYALVIGPNTGAIDFQDRPDHRDFISYILGSLSQNNEPHVSLPVNFGVSDHPYRGSYGPDTKYTSKPRWIPMCTMLGEVSSGFDQCVAEAGSVSFPPLNGLLMTNALPQKIYLTEIGWQNIALNQNGQPARSADPDMTDDLQAAYLVRLYTEMYAQPEVQRVNWFHLRDSIITDADLGTGGYNKTGYGLYDDVTNVRKAAFSAYIKTVAALRDSIFYNDSRSVTATAGNSLISYRFRKAGQTDVKTCWVAWMEKIFSEDEEGRYLSPAEIPLSLFGEGTYSELTGFWPGNTNTLSEDAGSQRLRLIKGNPFAFCRER